MTRSQKLVLGICYNLIKVIKKNNASTE